MTNAVELVLIGAVTGAFGVRGEVRARAFTAAPESLAAYGPLLHADGRVALTPRRLRVLTDAVAITAPEVTSREQAQAMKGTGLYVPRAALPPADEEEFYYVDLIGCAVEAVDGAPLGVVKAVQNFGADDLLEIAPPSGPTWFLPFTREAAPIVEIATRRIVSAQGPPRVGDDEQAP
jgi:16S rRNA processing protein RimM